MLNSEHGSIDAACGSVSREVDHMLPFSEVCGQRVLAAATAPFPNRVSSLSQRLLRGKRCVAVVDEFGVFGMGTAAPITTTPGQNRANQHERKVSYVAVVRTIWITYRVCTTAAPKPWRRVLLVIGSSSFMRGGRDDRIKSNEAQFISCLCRMRRMERA